MISRNQEALRWTRGPGQEPPSDPGRCEASPAGKGDSDLPDACSRAVATVVKAAGPGTAAGDIARIARLRGTERRIAEAVVGEAAGRPPVFSR
jgi:hypothetical protein